MESFEITFKKTMYVGYETSMSPHINREKKVMEYIVGYDDLRERGWYEMYDEESGGEEYYAEGSLIFNGNELIDYDGVFTLDENIIKCLEKQGIKNSL